MFDVSEVILPVTLADPAQDNTQQHSLNYFLFVNNLFVFKNMYFVFGALLY